MKELPTLPSGKLDWDQIEQDVQEECLDGVKTYIYKLRGQLSHTEEMYKDASIKADRLAAQLAAPQVQEAGDVIKGWVSRNKRSGAIDLNGFRSSPDEINTNHFVACPCTVIVHDPPQPPEPTDADRLRSIAGDIDQGAVGAKGELYGNALRIIAERLQAAGKGEQA